MLISPELGKSWECNCRMSPSLTIKIKGCKMVLSWVLEDVDQSEFLLLVTFVQAMMKGFIVMTLVAS